LVIGALQALYGPSIPAIREHFGIAPSVAGLGLSAHFTGALLGVLVFYRLHRRFSYRTLLALSYGLMGLGALLFAVAPTWSLAVSAAFVAGLGFGGIDYGINQLFSSGFGRKSAALLNMLHAQFGIGAVLGPVLVGWVGPENYSWIFVAVAVVSAGLLLTLRGVGQAEENTTDEGTTTKGAGSRTAGGNRTMLGIVLAFVVLYVLHVAVETGVGGWEPTHLQAVGYSAATAATATSSFWLMMTLGRFLAVPLSLRFSPPAIVTGACVGMALSLMIAVVPSLAFAGYLGVGLFIAPIFPTALPWLNRSAPGLGGASAYVIAASMFGGVGFPPLLGAAIELSGVRAVPVLLFVIASAAALLSLWLRRATRDIMSADTAVPTSDGPRKEIVP
jgi:fucose permease